MAWLLPQEDGHSISQSWERSMFSKSLGFVASQRNSPPQKPGDMCGTETFPDIDVSLSPSTWRCFSSCLYFSHIPPRPPLHEQVPHSAPEQKAGAQKQHPATKRRPGAALGTQQALCARLVQEALASRPCLIHRVSAFSSVSWECSKALLASLL